MNYKVKRDMKGKYAKKKNWKHKIIKAMIKGFFIYVLVAASFQLFTNFPHYVDVAERELFTSVSYNTN